ncbi:MAG: lysine--tRNA ligase [Lentisphaeria bacterium]|nr:lysine--tRNA ligase [Lentisphaeria bacterium]
MHWSEKIARNLIERNPEKSEYVCAAGISPSGSIHIGNFRDIATSFFVCKALQKLGKKAKLLFSWDEFDRLRKVPVNVAKVTEGFEVHIGKPYTDVPDPFGCCENYAKHFQNEFEKSLKKFGIEVDFRYQTSCYRSGQYSKYIIEALQKRKEIFDILDSFRTQESTPEEREQYCPVGIYCPVCGRDTTTVTAIADDCLSAEYTCKCGHSGKFDFTTDFNCKLAWKIDWPMRWLYEKVDFEPGGKDHASPSGSYQTSRVIAKKIFGFEAPMFQGYEFIGIKGATGKMSGSTGLNLTPDTLLKLYQPEVILWLYSKSDPTKSFDFCFDDEILRQYFEFDKMYDAFTRGTDDEYINNIMELVVDPAKPIKTVPMAQLVSLGSVVDFNPDVLETVFTKIGTPYAKEDFLPRLELARYWLEVCAPQNMNTLRAEKDVEFFNTLTDEEKHSVRLLRDYIKKGGYTLDELMAYLYAIPREVYGEMDDKELKKYQGKFFQNVYTLLISKTKGPRLYLFLYAIETEKYLHLLDF